MQRLLQLGISFVAFLPRNVLKKAEKLANNRPQPKEKMFAVHEIG